MATAPDTVAADATDGAPPEAPIDFEAEARKMGWSSLEEFKGDPKHHLDAETFYNRAVEYMPIAKATIKKLTGKIDSLERDMRRSADFFSKAEQRAYERALDEIRKEQEAAVENGDVEAHRRASEKLDKLEKPSARAADDISPEQRAEDFADWGKSNKWYATNAVMQSYADAQAQALASKKGGFLDRADLDRVSEKVREKFEDEFPEAFGAARPKARNLTEGVSAGRSPRGGKSFSDLPPEAQKMCDKWVKNGLIKSREDYVKSYEWDK